MNATLRIITPQAARLEDYSEITVPINPRTEAEIFRNLERQLEGVDGVWIKHPNGTMSAARRTSELVIYSPRSNREPLEVELLVDEHARRDADPILDHAPAVRSKVDADRLLQILDELAQ